MQDFRFPPSIKTEPLPWKAPIEIPARQHIRYSDSRMWKPMDPDLNLDRSWKMGPSIFDQWQIFRFDSLYWGTGGPMLNKTLFPTTLAFIRLSLGGSCLTMWTQENTPRSCASFEKLAQWHIGSWPTPTGQ